MANLVKRDELEEHQMQAIIHAKSAIDYAKVAIERQGQAVAMAIISGEHLIQVRAGMNHGEWLPWIEEKMPVNQRMCYNYIDAYTYREHPKLQRVASIREGIAVIKALRRAEKGEPEPPHQAVIDLMNVDKAEEVYERLDGEGKHRLLSRIIHKEGFFYGSYLDLIPENPHDKPDLCLAVARVIRQHSHPDKGGTDEELMAATEAYDKLKRILDNV